jgi:arylsulfatase A-like enzyme
MGPRAHRTWLSAKDASPAPGFGDYRPDPLTAAVALDVLRESRPSFLFVGLGDTDEYAHHRDYAGYLRALEHADSVIGAIDDELATLRRRGVDTLLVVTTDHGRSKSFADHGDDPESSRVWLVAAGEAVRSRHLADIAPTVHALAGRAPSPTHQGRPIPELLAPRRTTLASADRSSRMNEERTWP